MRGSDEKIVTLIGDASLAGGMAFEALNDLGQAQTPLVIILNDNEMSISRNVGAMAKHLGSLRVSNNYRKSRDSMQDFVESSFGHDIPALKATLRRALSSEVPVLVHVVTKKGAGYAPAEKDPSRFHGVGPFDRASGASLKSSDSTLTYTQAFTYAFNQEAQRDDKICAISAAMIDGTGLRDFATSHPDRCFDVGIAEAHAVGLASGLALGGYKPLVALYSTFLHRAIDQSIINVALCNLPVVFAIDRAGLVGDDGPTHHGMFDMALLRTIPNMRIIAPSNEAELVHALHTAFMLPGPVVLRYPRGSAQGVSLPQDPLYMKPGCARVVREGSDAAILAFGRMVGYALDAAHMLESEGHHVRVVDMRWVKPLDKEAIAEAAKTGIVVTVEDGVRIGGAGEGVAEELALQGLNPSFENIGIPDSFIEQGKVDQLFADLGLDAQGIAQVIRKYL